jgi:hypothetical protein
VQGEKRTFTEVRHACTVLFNFRVESCDRLALGRDLAPKPSNERFCLFRLLALAFKHCNGHTLNSKKPKAR